MRTPILLTVFVLLSAQWAGAQCDPDLSYTVPGIYPTVLPDAPADQPYSAVLTVVSGSEVPGFPIPLTSYEITGIDGLPAGFTYACVPSNCIFLPNSYGCVLITGNPTQSQVGNYPVTVNILVNGSFNYPLTDYYINITGQGGGGCFVGYLQSDFSQTVCPGFPGQMDMIDVEVPTGGGYGLYFVPGADGAGGPDSDFTLSDIGLPYPFDADLNGVLSFNGLGPLTGTWEVYFFVYTDENDPVNTICSYSYDDTYEWLDVQFFDANDPECLSIGVQEAPEVELSSILSPNPTTGPLTLKFGTAATRTATLLDATGRQVMTTTLQGTTGTMDLSTLSTGVYVLRVAEGSTTHHARVVRQ